MNFGETETIVMIMWRSDHGNKLFLIALNPLIIGKIEMLIMCFIGSWRTG